MEKRYELQAILEQIMLSLHPTKLPDSKSANAYHVYFQPDDNVGMIYPAIRYERDSVDARHANNQLYSRRKTYQVIIIDRNPDSRIPDAVARLPYTRFVSHYKQDGLNHDVYQISY